MANDNPNYYFGPTRHTASAQSQFSDPTPIQRQAVGSISQPAEATQESVGTSAILNQAGRRGGRRRGASLTMGAMAPAGPDLGLYGGSQEEIIDASGVQKAYNKVDASAAERMSDRDPDRPPVTPLTDEDAPLLTRIRAKLSPPDYFATE